jgi:hypothetical protein
MRDALGPADFEPHVGSRFIVPSEAGDDRTMTLASVVRQAQPSSPRADPFSLVFVGDLVLDQRIHELRHDELGVLAIFLVPIGPDSSGQLQYEAVFN